MGLRRTRINIGERVIHPAFWGTVAWIQVNYSNTKHKCSFDMCSFLIPLHLKGYFKVYFKDDQTNQEHNTEIIVISEVEKFVRKKCNH